MKGRTNKEKEYSLIVEKMDNQIKELETIRKAKIQELAFKLWGMPKIDTDVLVECKINGFGTVVSWVVAVDFDNVPIINYKVKNNRGKIFSQTQKI